MWDWLTDFRAAFRALRRRPVYAAAVTLALSLGLAAAATAYALVDAITNPQHPYVRPEELWQIRIAASGIPIPPVQRWTRAGTQLPFVAGIAQWEGALRRASIEIDGRVLEARGAVVSDELFAVLGIAPVVGRLPSVHATGQPEVVISDRLWAQASEGHEFSPFVVSRGADRLLVTGVLPRHTDFPPNADYWQPADVSERMDRYVLRARRGATQDGIATVLRTAFDEQRTGPSGRESPRFVIEPLLKPSARIDAVHQALFAGCMAVLVIVCLNLASTQFTRGLARQRELAIRAVLGASPQQLMRAVAAESVITTAIAGVFGTLVSFWTSRALLAYGPVSVSFIGSFEPQWSLRTILFATATSVVAGVMVCGLPALWLVRGRRPGASLHRATQAARRSGGRVFAVIVVAELALALVLVFVASLMGKEAERVMKLDVGYDVDHLVSVPLRTSLTDLKGDSSAATADSSSYANAGVRIRRVFDRLRSDSGVGKASLTYFLTLDGNRISAVDARGRARDYSLRDAFVRVVSAEFFSTMHILGPNGSAFDPSTSVLETPSVVIDERLANRLWPQRPGIGQRVKLGSLASNRPWLPVSAIVRPTVFAVGMCATEECYAPSIFVLDPTASQYAGREYGSLAQAFLRINNDGAPLLRLHRTLANARDVSAFGISLIADEMQLTAMRASYHFLSIVFSAFALGGLLLSALGVFALVSADVDERMKEYGVRIALGASPGDLARRVLSAAARVALYGFLLGALLSYWTVDLFRYLVADLADFGLERMLFAGLLLVTSVLLASLRPALIAARTEAAAMLRTD